ncbi:MAG: hypothetical protein RLZZ245_2712 [Verrucomicrobiota bacterium]|jgi:hypothetical protein
MEKLRGSHILERGELFLRVWQHQAPQHERFAGIDCQELNAEIDAVKAARERVRAAETLLRGLRLERDQADRKLAKKLMRIASGVRAEPAFGEDCGVYRALGFVPLSENRGGRPRKPSTVKTQKRTTPPA